MPKGRAFNYHLLEDLAGFSVVFPSQISKLGIVSSHRQICGTGDVRSIELFKIRILSRRASRSQTPFETAVLLGALVAMPLGGFS